MRMLHNWTELEVRPAIKKTSLAHVESDHI